ncbi:unnamed protein product, partial [Polarella glacialis]
SRMQLSSRSPFGMTDKSRQFRISRPERTLASTSIVALASLEEVVKNEDFAEFLSRSQEIFGLIDADKGRSISKFELVGAVYRNANVAAFVLPSTSQRNPTKDHSGQVVLVDEQSFDVIDDVFNAMSGGRQRVKFPEFASYFWRTASGSMQASAITREMQALFKLIDADGNGAVSKLEFVSAFQRYKQVSMLLLPTVDHTRVLEEESSYDAVAAVFDSMAGGKQRILWPDFELYCSQASVVRSPFGSSPLSSPVGSPRIPRGPTERRYVRVLAFGPSFGLEKNPGQ